MGLDKHGRVAVVTGAAAGIGPEYAVRLAQDGADIAIADIEAADETAERVRATGRRVLHRSVDVSDPEAVAGFARDVFAELGDVDILVNNVGISPYNLFEDITLEEWRRCMTVNLDSLFLMCKAFLPGMRQRQWGRIVNVTTSACWMPEVPRMSHYVTSKMGVVGFTRALATEVGPQFVTVNCVSPSLVRTPLLEQRLTPEWFQEMVDTQSIKRVQETADMVGAVSFLTSDDAAFITGQTLAVNGGNVRL
ncbi:MAG TPA: SDR family oxidoreductase [Candidatus Dormibacteraeota bacterium]|jgi:NAD(P)-dependent dehydrogenase (short-subunit alcohol dehydrogenase family)|nr:SDR family oxidoreductase [Candidatus Dormibacteraeota bacterium]